MNAAQPRPIYDMPAKAKHVPFKSEAEYGAHLAEMAKAENAQLRAQIGNDQRSDYDRIGADGLQAVEDFIAAHPMSSRQQVQDGLGYTQTTATCAIKLLYDEGRVIRHKVGKGKVYAYTVPA